MKRFGRQESPLEPETEETETTLVASKEECIKLVDSLPEIPAGEMRLEALHLHGTNEMSSKDVFSYFKLYSPRNIEWVNDSSCNVVWDDSQSASRALKGLGSRPLVLRSSGQTTGNEEQKETAELPDRSPSAETLSDQGQDAGDVAGPQPQRPVQEEESSGTLLQWRDGGSHPKAEQLLLRYATQLDVKERGAANRSAYYRKHGRPGFPTPSSRGSRKEAKEDLRVRIGKRSLQQRVKQEDEEEEEEEEKEEEPMEVTTTPAEDSPYASLSKRPKPLHSDRPDDALDVTEMMGESERQRVLAEVGGASGRVGLGGAEGDLRRALQQKKKKRNLQLRIGHSPRIVEVEK